MSVCFTYYFVCLFLYCTHVVPVVPNFLSFRAPHQLLKKMSSPPNPTHAHTSFQTPLHFILHLLINPNYNFLFFLDQKKKKKLSNKPPPVELKVRQVCLIRFVL